MTTSNVYATLPVGYYTIGSLGGNHRNSYIRRLLSRLCKTKEISSIEVAWRSRTGKTYAVLPKDVPPYVRVMIQKAGLKFPIIDAQSIVSAPVAQVQAPQAAPMQMNMSSKVIKDLQKLLEINEQQAMGVLCFVEIFKK